jgi:transposase
MEINRTFVASSTQVEERRSTLGAQPSGAGRYSLDPAHRSTLARLARAVSQSLDLLATLAKVGRGRCLVGNLAHFPSHTGPVWAARLERSLCRWQFRTGQKGGLGVGKTKRGKGTKWMVVVDGQGVPLGIHLDAASPAEVKLLEPTLAQIAVPRAGRGRPRQKLQRLIADKAYDSDPLRFRLKRRGIELIVPHKINRKKPPTQDGRPLRRYRKRWKVERTFSWFGNYRRLVVRWERSLTVYLAFFHLTCLLITLNQL